MSTYHVDWTSGNAEEIYGKAPIILPQKTLNRDTSLVLTGKGVNNYGTYQQENFLALMENFAGDNVPANPTVGQLWWNPKEIALYLCVEIEKTVGHDLYHYAPPLAWICVFPGDGAVVNTSTIISPPAYNVAVAPVTSVTEGSSIVISINTTNVFSGTVLYWRNVGSTVAADFVENSNQGSIIINSNSATVVRNILDDNLPETTETVKIELYTDSSFTTKVATSNTVYVVSLTGPVDVPPVANFVVADNGAGSSRNLPFVAQFTDTSINAPTGWLWEFDDGTTSTLQNPTKSFNTFGFKSVKLTVTNAFGVSSITINNALELGIDTIQEGRVLSCPAAYSVPALASGMLPPNAAISDGRVVDRSGIVYSISQSGFSADAFQYISNGVSQFGWGRALQFRTVKYLNGNPVKLNASGVVVPVAVNDDWATSKVGTSADISTYVSQRGFIFTTPNTDINNRVFLAADGVIQHLDTSITAPAASYTVTGTSFTRVGNDISVLNGTSITLTDNSVGSVNYRKWDLVGLTAAQQTANAIIVTGSSTTKSGNLIVSNGGGRTSLPFNITFHA